MAQAFASSSSSAATTPFLYLNQKESVQQATPLYPPSHFSHILENVKNRNNFLNLGLEPSAQSGQAFLELYHEFQGTIVGVDANPEHVQAMKARAKQILPTQALTRTKLIAGDIFDVEGQLDNKQQLFDLVAVGSEVHNVATADRLFDFVKSKLLDQEGTLAILSVRPESITFQHGGDYDKANSNIEQDFQEFNENIEEYGDLSSNPLYNEGVQTRHFSDITQLHNRVDSIITADQLIRQLQQSYAYTQYFNDPTQADRSALIAFQRKLNANVAARKALNHNHLIRVSHKILTYLLKRR